MATDDRDTHKRPTVPYSDSVRRDIPAIVRRLYQAHGSWPKVGKAIGALSPAYWYLVAHDRLTPNDDAVRALLLYEEMYGGTIEVPVCPTCGGYHGPMTVDCHGKPAHIMVLHTEDEAVWQDVGHRHTYKPGRGTSFVLTPVYGRTLTPTNSDDSTPLYGHVLTPNNEAALTPKSPNMGKSSRLRKSKKRDRKNISVPTEIHDRVNAWRQERKLEWSDVLTLAMESDDAQEIGDDAGRNVVSSPGEPSTATG